MFQNSINKSLTPVKIALKNARTPLVRTQLKARFAPKACERFSARFDGRQTFVYAILKHSALFNAIRLRNLFHHNTKIPERNILCSITTKLTIRATSKTHATLTSPLVRIQLYDHLRWMILGWSRTIGGKSCDVARRCTTSQSSGANLTMSWQFLVMSKNFLRFSFMWDIWRLSCDVVWRHVRHRATSRLIARYVCNRRAMTSYDFIYDRTTS